MEFRLLGDTGVRVSAYALGSVMFGAWGNNDERECSAIVNRALDGGINLIDTADAYSDGQAEEIIGRAIRSRRDEVLVATKFHAPMGPGPNERGNSRLWIMRAVESSLRRLGTDHIDLYQVHQPDADVPLAETLGALDALVTQGKVRYIGCSNFQAWQLAEAQAVSRERNCVRFVCEQPPYSIMARSVERDVLPVAQRYHMGAIVWSPLAGGWLAGRYQRGEAPPADTRAGRVDEYHRRGGRMHERYQMASEANIAKFDVVAGLAKLADAACLPMVDLALAFTLAHPAVTSCLIGPRTLGQLESILAGADTRLDEVTLDAIDELVPPGSVLNPADSEFAQPWLSTSARRRPSQSRSS
jgi:aryl-alcohol dehydrogenase-like predicted oxidoreductase